MSEPDSKSLKATLPQSVFEQAYRAGARLGGLSDLSKVVKNQFHSDIHAIVAKTVKAAEWQDRIEHKIDKLVTEIRTLKTAAAQSQKHEWYSVAEVASMFGVTENRVREWCRDGRVNAEKQRTGRGKHPTWVISNSEIERYRREGLLPERKRR